MAETPLLDKIKERMSNFKDISDFEDLYSESPKIHTNSIIHQMLVVHRNYVIEHIKLPIRHHLYTIAFGVCSWWVKLKCLLDLFRIIKKYPNPTKENTRYRNTHVTIDIVGRFNNFHNNTARDKLFNAAYPLITDEFEHDGYYAALRDWWVEEIIKEILAGRWLPRPEGWPQPKYWKEPQPYGGEHSIVYKLQRKRKEILELIGGNDV
uniref:Uncharacterized protein n=1 Tax=viral metagenome TaxID=1070528 RepID=A0A6M3IY57_9ZZZZ